MYGFINMYNTLREDIAKMIQLDPELLGGDKWLRHAIQTSEMTLRENDDTISVYGTTYTMQTMDHEWFEFEIPKSDVQLFQLRAVLAERAVTP